MTALELIQIGLAGAGVAVGGGIWFRLGTLSGSLKGVISFTERLNARVERLENHVFFNKENPNA